MGEQKRNPVWGNPPLAKPEESDRELQRLVKRSMRGDEIALYSLCEHVARRVLFLSSHILKKPEDAEDVSQEVMIRVCEKISELHSPEAFWVWLSKIVANESRQHIRSNTNHGIVVDIDDYLGDILEKDEALLPQEYTENEEFRKHIMEMIDDLPPRQREAVLLHYYGGLSVTEIAEEMDISHSNASRYLGLAREKLRQGLGKYPTGTVTLHSAAIPFSAVIAGVLKQESFAFNPGNMEWLGAALSQYRAQIHQQRSLPHNTVAETLFWPAVAALSAVVMTAGIFLGASHYEALQLPVSSSPVTGQINFVGGEEKDATLICQNPTGASPQMNNADGALTAFEWFITPADSDARLYSGEGGDADAALLQLRESGEAGKYILHVLFQDDSGNVYRAYESFLVGSAV